MLIVPENWDYSGSIKIRFAVENYNGWNVNEIYNITSTPLAHSWQIGNMVNVSDPILYNYTTYPFERSTTYNTTLTDWSPFSYLFMDCYGDAFSWTQLVVNTKNV